MENRGWKISNPSPWINECRRNYTNFRRELNVIVTSRNSIYWSGHNLLAKIEIKPTKKWATAHNFHPIHRYSSRNLSIFLRNLTVHQSKPYVHLTAESHHHGLIIILHVVCASFAEWKTTRPIHPPLPSSSHEEGSRNFRWNGEFELLHPSRGMDPSSTDLVQLSSRGGESFHRILSTAI